MDSDTDLQDYSLLSSISSEDTNSEEKPTALQEAETLEIAPAVPQEQQQLETGTSEAEGLRQNTSSVSDFIGIEPVQENLEPHAHHNLLTVPLDTEGEEEHNAKKDVISSGIQRLTTQEKDGNLNEELASTEAIQKSDLEVPITSSESEEKKNSDRLSVKNYIKMFEGKMDDSQATPSTCLQGHDSGDKEDHDGNGSILQHPLHHEIQHKPDEMKDIEMLQKEQDLNKWEQYEEDEDKEQLYEVTSSGEADQYSTPTGSPVTHQKFSHQPSEKDCKPSSFTSAERGTPGAVQLSDKVDSEKMTSPMPMSDAVRSQSMQNLDQTGAFQPLAQRSEYGKSEQDVHAYVQQQQQFRSHFHPPRRGLQKSDVDVQQSRQSSLRFSSPQTYQQNQHYQPQPSPRQYHQLHWQQNQHYQPYPSPGQQRQQQQQDPRCPPHQMQSSKAQSVKDVKSPSDKNQSGFRPQTVQQNTGQPPLQEPSESSENTGSLQGKIPGNTVRVDGVDSDMDLEFLQLYFESHKKSGGGAVSKLSDHTSQGFVLLTFKDPGVLDRLMQRSHTVNKRALKLSIYQECEEEPFEDLSSTVEVSGGSVALDEDMMELYFENTKKSGGGPIAKIEVKVEAGVTLITFQEQKVAEAVVKRSHTISRTQLTVVPYTLPGPPTQVKVSGLTSRASEELLQLYFEKVGQCDVKDVQLVEAKGEAVVTFVDAAGVETVLSKKDHRINSKPVTVSHLNASANLTQAKDSNLNRMECSTVEVRGLLSSTTEETVQFYFENKRRSGGGPIKDMHFDSKSGVAQVTFEEEETAQRVLEKKHTIDGRQLQVSLYTQPSNPKTAAIERNKSEELSTVSVRGLNMSTSTDTLMNYFENSRRSDGGDVINVTLDKKEAIFFVTFENPEDAARVASREHWLENQKLQVTLFKPPEMYKDRLLVGNLPEVKSAEELLYFLENKTSLNVTTVLFSQEEACMAVAIFETDVDFEKVVADLTAKPFKEHHISVDSIPVSNTVLVSNLPQNPPISPETILNYFENTRRSGGGEVLDVQMADDMSYALVNFEDTEVAEMVASRQHKFQNHQVSVSIYMECLGLGGGSEEPTAKIPRPVTISEDNFHKLSLLDKLPDLMEAFKTSLNSCHAHLELNIPLGSATCACTLTAEMEGLCQKVKSWSDDVAYIQKTHLEEIFSEQLQVSIEEITEIQESIQELIAGIPEVGIYCDTEQNQLLIIYKGTERRPLVDSVIAEVREVQRNLRRKKEEKTDRIVNSPGKLLLLQKHNITEELQRSHPTLVITDCSGNGYLELKGCHDEIQTVKMVVLEKISAITSLRHNWNSKLHEDLFKHPSARERVVRVCSEKEPDGIVDFTSTGFEVHSFKAERAEVMQVTACNVVQKRVIKFDSCTQQVVMTQEWADLKNSILEGNKDLAKFEENELSLTMLSVSPSVQEDFKRLQKLLQKNSIQKLIIPLPKALHKLFFPYLPKKISHLGLNMEVFCPDPENDQIVVEGNSSNIEIAQKICSAFREELTDCCKTYTEPSMEEFFKTAEWMRKKDEIEGDQKCLVLEPDELLEEFMGPAYAVKRVSRPLNTADNSFSEDLMSELPSNFMFQNSPVIKSSAARNSRRLKSATAQPHQAANLPKADLPARPRLFLSVMSDITKEEHHVLVNSTNPELNLAMGQVSKALLKAGGVEIQQECAASYPNGIKMGEVAITGGGKLNCKKVFHCTLPDKIDDEKVKEVIRNAVMKCMAEAERLELGSIGFPSLGTGTLGYPAAIVAHTMFEAALDYGRQNSSTVISDVFFILHKKDETLTQVYREEHAIYKELLKASILNESDNESYLAEENPSTHGIERFPYFEETRGHVSKVFVGIGLHVVKKAESELLACYKAMVKTISETVPSLDQWDELHKDNLRNACKIRKLDLTLNFSLGRLEIRGFIENIRHIPLHSILKEAEVFVGERKNARLLSQRVQWSFIEVDLEGEKLQPYDMMSNYKIETAYQAGEENVVIMATEDDVNVAYIINFTKMEEKCEDPQAESEPAKIIRQDKVKNLDVQPPRSWTDMTGKDLDVVPVANTSSEYDHVQQIFMQSLQRPSAKIVKIERVQNLTLYKQYHSLKQMIEKDMPNNKLCERKDLWHGTTEVAVQGIIKYGFNRSYCSTEPSKTVYGQGAYFATSAEYSSRNEYAKADPYSKERQMFLCNVLVGQYTVGSQDMRIPPEITAGGLRYNSTVDDDKEPQIYVTYYDVQAYPEYRIVFKDQ